MKVLLINGSPRRDGCTYTALSEVASQLHREGIDTEIAHIGTGPVRGCIDCMVCRETGGHCVFDDDVCNQLAQKLEAADGLVVGSPVYYAGPNGALTAILDRMFFSCAQRFAGKPAAAVLNCRRGGASAAYDRLNKYFTITQMPVVSSQYWNATHGTTPEELRQDLEGLQVMRTLGKNMARLLRGLEHEPLPEPEERIATNFIRQ